MKRISLLFSLLLTAAMLFAVPAKPVWQTITLADGTTVKVMKCGDENFHYLKTADGAFLLRDADGTYREVTRDEVVAKQQTSPRCAAVAERRAARLAARHATRMVNRAPTKTDGENKAEVMYLDSVERRGLVIMVSFSDQEFRDENAYQEWSDILNKPGYNEHDAAGSVHDYFYDQSNGMFNLKFDVIGPIKLSKSHYYYGDNGRFGGLDIKIGELIDEACHAVDDKVDFTKYDWDSDGEVDQVFFLYAGCGEHGEANPNDSLIWPHEFWLEYHSGYENCITLDGVKINTYACGSELDGGEKDPIKVQSGLGVFCHEFSHCLGLPDLYDTQFGLQDMLDYWDLLSMGVYNNGGWTPPNYSAYEREFCGWQQPVVLSEPTTITGMKALGEDGETYRINHDCQDSTKIEYILVENRQKTGWDKYLPGENVLITMIYYRKTYWDGNAVNTGYNGYASHGVTIIPASGVYTADANVSYPYTNPETGLVNDSLTDNSNPAAKMHRKGKDNTYYLHKPITEIKVEDGLASFKFCGGTPETGIDKVIAATNAELWGKPATIYDAQGRIVRRVDTFNGIDDLNKGLYIVKGLNGLSLKMLK